MLQISKSILSIMLIAIVLVLAGCTKHDETNGGNGGGVYNGHYEYVDLGLPSGTLWATCNVGANTPEGYGDFFAWGETEPKASYNWITYKWSRGLFNRLTKYCNDATYSYNNHIDTLTVLQPDDDAATVAWGSDWSMPLKEQWQELKEYTTCTNTTQNNVDGRLFTSANGNSIFLPATGFLWDNDLLCQGEDGCYWSRSLYADVPTDAWVFDFYSNDNEYNIYRAYRDDGRPVRAVRAMK